jgi:hypothetical protein
MRARARQRVARRAREAARGVACEAPAALSSAATADGLCDVSCLLPGYKSLAGARCPHC